MCKFGTFLNFSGLSAIGKLLLLLLLLITSVLIVILIMDNLLFSYCLSWYINVSGDDDNNMQNAEYFICLFSLIKVSNVKHTYR